MPTCYSTLNDICFDFSREVLAFDYLKRVCQHFESSPDLGTALILHIELLLQKGRELLAKQKIEDIITGNKSLNQTNIFNSIYINVKIQNYTRDLYRIRVNQKTVQCKQFNCSILHSVFDSGTLRPT